MRRLAMGSFLLIVLVAHTGAASSQKSRIQCNATGGSKQKLLALDDGVWRRHSAALEKELGGESQIATISRGTEVLVTMYSDTAGDIWSHYELCYDKSGKLLTAYYEAQTAWGWGYRAINSKGRFFKNKTGKVIPNPIKPEDGAFLAEDWLAMRELYKNFKNLPFGHLVNVAKDF